VQTLAGPTAQTKPDSSSARKRRVKETISDRASLTLPSPSSSAAAAAGEGTNVSATGPVGVAASAGMKKHVKDKRKKRGYFCH